MDHTLSSDLLYFDNKWKNYLVWYR